MPKYLWAAVARERNPYWWVNPRQFLYIFHHSWEEIKISACKRLRQISRSVYKIYVLIDLVRCFRARVCAYVLYVYIYICEMPIFKMLFSTRIPRELKKREQSKRHNIRRNRLIRLSKYYLFLLKTFPFLSSFQEVI